MLSLLKKNISLILFLVILLSSSVLKIMEVSHNNFPFTTDQGRDMVDMRHMVVTHSPRLVGPTTSINGVLLGPFWYYFNLIPFVAGGGDPSFLVYWQILWYQLSVVALWFVLKKNHSSLAVIVSVLLFLMPTGFNTARYFWNANSMVFFTTLYFAALIFAFHVSPSKLKTNTPAPITLLVLGLVSGISMQIEAAFGILFFPFALLYLLTCHSRPEWAEGARKGESIKFKIKKLIYLTTGFGLTLLPQVLFEFKHGYIMTKILLGEFFGQGTMLGEKITFAEKLTQRWEHFQLLILRSTHLPPNYVPYLYTVSLALFLYIIIAAKKSKFKEIKIWSLSFWFILFSAVFYLLFPQKLKEWYTLGLSVPIVLFFGCFLNYLWERKAHIFKFFVGLLVGMLIYYSLKSQWDYTRDVAWKPSDDRSNLQNEIAALDWVYQNAEGNGFKVYSYLPSVYDFPYNHLFWWYGNQKYGYEPIETAYLPDQPEYIRDVDKIWTNKRDLGSKNLTFLIIEEDMDMPIRMQAWLGNFSKLCLLKEQVFFWHASVRLLVPCPK
ncbi:hypothetical protein AUJ42_00285 [Candidatus Collierbacteria bacterium CG1_02_44_10]|uniref:Glycosyltransferase RgtA/B/C/D-like domain-containing protein n=2 Tax=Candidatus Collieribacteriota TaxID=1752725 RepID=A0A2H0VK07_9BACT|nr:MAG: hypothetical protein AUJ42_00285 [Candidatus Collierbacteria bacterium CG1_02_44_10]PIR99421.1 MAG: hypothetical protein COT86_03950 [Candidatus Collierbacteria bacterium CG10_big_fil_rev_8_21_14_0_10_43_36]